MVDKHITRRQLEANRRNAQRAGVKTPEGKAVSRLNARKHGIFAAALTGQDRQELAAVRERFLEDLEPVGMAEETLVEKLALTWLRLQRCARAEAEYHRSTWAPGPDGKGELNPTSWFRPGQFEKIAGLINRYDKSLTNQYLRLLHELERLRRQRGGEPVAPPVATDVNVTGG